MNGTWRWAPGPRRGRVELVRELAGRGYRLGILTRNARELAHVTLEAIGLADCFAVEDVLGRDEAPPKPHPGGLLKLAEAWNVVPEAMVMVGDYRFDLDCGRAAGARTVLVNLPDNPWPELTDWHARDCGELRRMLFSLSAGLTARLLSRASSLPQWICGEHRFCNRQRTPVGASLLAIAPCHSRQNSLTKQHLQPLGRSQHPISVMPHSGHFDQPLVQPHGMAPGQVVEKEMPAQ